MKDKKVVGLSLLCLILWVLLCFMVGTNYQVTNKYNDCAKKYNKVMKELGKVDSGMGIKLLYNESLDINNTFDFGIKKQKQSIEPYNGLKQSKQCFGSETKSELIGGSTK